MAQSYGLALGSEAPWPILKALPTWRESDSNRRPPDYEPGGDDLAPPSRYPGAL